MRRRVVVVRRRAAGARRGAAQRRPTAAPTRPGCRPTPAVDAARDRVPRRARRAVAVRRARPQRRARRRRRRGARASPRRSRPTPAASSSSPTSTATPTTTRAIAAPARPAVPRRSRRRAGRRPGGPAAHRPRSSTSSRTGRGPTHAVVVHPTVMWALAGDTSADPDLPFGAELVEIGTGDAPSGDTLRRRHRRRRRAAARRWRCAARPAARFLVSPLPDDDGGWAALVREATIVGAGVVVDSTTRCRRRPPLDRAGRPPRVGDRRRASSCPSSEMPDRPWRDHHAPATEPTDDEWAAALGDIAAHPPPDADPAAPGRPASTAAAATSTGAVRRLAGGQIDTLARRIRPTRGVGRHRAVARPHRSCCARSSTATATPTRSTTSGGSRRRRRGARSPCSPGRRAPARRWPPRSSPASSASTCSSSTCRRSSASTSARPRRTSTRSSTPPSAGNVVLFFDEADSLFGKRSEVKRRPRPLRQHRGVVPPAAPRGLRRARHAGDELRAATSTTRSCAGSTCASSSRCPTRPSARRSGSTTCRRGAPLAADVDVAVPRQPLRAQRRLDPQRRAAGRVPRRRRRRDHRHGRASSAASAASTRSSAAC